LDKTIASLTLLKSQQQVEIGRLEKARDATLGKSQSAEVLETLIAQLSNQISEKQQVKSDVVAQHQDELQEAERECDRKLDNYTTLIGNLTLSINEAQRELDLLLENHTAAEPSSVGTTFLLAFGKNNITIVPGPHPLRGELEDAKAAIRKIIAQHQDDINSISLSIKAKEEAIAEVEKQRERQAADFDGALKKNSLTKRSNYPKITGPPWPVRLTP